MAINADRIWKGIRKRHDAPDLQPLYAAGEQRATWRLTAGRREILAEIISEQPDVTVQAIVMSYDLSENHPGGRLRHRLKQWCETRGLPEPDKPSESTLYRDFAESRSKPQTSRTGSADRKSPG